MSTKKIILIIAGILAALGLVVALFVGGIVYFVFHTIGNSEAAEASRTYLRNNEVLKQDIGEVRDFGSFITGNINVSNGDGEARLYLKVIGAKREVNARVDLSYRSNQKWPVTRPPYQPDRPTINLMKPYEQSH